MSINELISINNKKIKYIGLIFINICQWDILSDPEIILEQHLHRVYLESRPYFIRYSIPLHYNSVFVYS